MLRHFVRAYILNRLLRGSRHRGYGHRPRSRGSRHRGYGRHPRGRGGFRGPFPHYTRRTRGGGRVHVTGCCLPIPLGILGALAYATRLLAKR